MDLCILIDVSPLADKLEGALDITISRVGALLYKALHANYSIRWGYRFIDSRSEPHAFETVYKNVAGYADAEFPAGSPLQKGGFVGLGNPSVVHLDAFGPPDRCG